MIGQVFDPPVGAAVLSVDVAAAGVVAVGAVAAVAVAGAVVEAASEGGSRSPGGVMSDAADGWTVAGLASDDVRSAGAVRAWRLLGRFGRRFLPEGGRRRQRSQQNQREALQRRATARLSMDRAG